MANAVKDKVVIVTGASGGAMQKQLYPLERAPEVVAWDPI